METFYRKICIEMYVYAKYNKFKMTTLMLSGMYIAQAIYIQQNPDYLTHVYKTMQTTISSMDIASPKIMETLSAPIVMQDITNTQVGWSMILSLPTAINLLFHRRHSLFRTRKKE